MASSIGALTLAAGQGASQATMDGATSNAVGDDEQGWLGGSTQSVSAAMGAIAPLVAGALDAGVSDAAPCWLGAVIMVVAIVVALRAPIVEAARADDESTAGTDSLTASAPVHA